MFQNDQKHFKNLVANATRFLQMLYTLKGLRFFFQYHSDIRTLASFADLELSIFVSILLDRTQFFR